MKELKRHPAAAVKEPCIIFSPVIDLNQVQYMLQITVEFWQEKIVVTLRRADTEPSVAFRRANTEPSLDFRKPRPFFLFYLD